MKHSLIDHQLSKIEKLVELKAEELELKNYEKYHHLHKIAIQFLKKQKVLLYGGYAINELMPEKDKIYPKFTLPDIDIFTVNSRKLGRDLVATYRAHGIDMASVSEALHPGTYRLYVDGVQVVDITTVSLAAFNKLSKRAVRTSSGLKTVDPQFLRLSLHMILSQANNADRWPKVFQRLITFYRRFPPEVCAARPQSKKSIEQLPEDMVVAIYKFLKQSPYIVFGAKEIKDMSGEAMVDSSIPWIQIVTDKDLQYVAKELINTLPAYSFKVSKLYTGDDFISDHLFITFKGKKVIAIYGADTCLTFNKYQGMHVATIHTMIRMYLSMLLSPYKHFEEISDYLECMTNSLSILQQKSIGSKRTLLQQLVIECYGMDHGLITLKRERILRLMQK